jgi:hypothetical protein
MLRGGTLRTVPNARALFPEVVVTGTIGDGRMAQRQGSRREDRGRWGGITLAGKDVQDDVGGVDTVGDRLGAGGLDRQQPVGEHRGEDVDHLPIAIVGAGELAPHALHCRRQHPVLEGCAVAQGAGLAGEYRHTPIPRLRGSKLHAE